MAANGEHIAEQHKEKEELREEPVTFLNPDNRPSSVSNAMQRAVTEAEHSITRYVYIGDKGYVCSAGDPEQESSGNQIRLLPPCIDIKKLVKILSAGKQFDLLDIGTGVGAVLNSYRDDFKINATGISLHKYKKADENYIIGDAHNLDKLLRKNKKFDLILGFKVYMHMVDPWGALVSAYDKLKSGGFLIIDTIPLECNTEVCSILNFLKEQKVELYASRLQQRNSHFGQNALNMLILKKTTESLNLPLQYQEQLSGITECAQYESTINFNYSFANYSEYNPNQPPNIIINELCLLFGIEHFSDIFTMDYKKAASIRFRCYEKKPLPGMQFWSQDDVEEMIQDFEQCLEEDPANRSCCIV